MRRATSFLSIATLLLGARLAMAQNPPENFAGHWVLVVVNANPGAGDGAAPRRGGAGGGNATAASTFGNDFLLVQDAKTLTIKRLDTTYGDTLSNSYNFDGTETTNGGLFTRGTNPAPSKATAKWVGKKLVITSTGGFVGAAGGNTGVTTTTVLMQGKQLRIETERPGNNGGAGASILNFFNKAK